jgi:hypothetical protein
MVADPAARECATLTFAIFFVSDRIASNEVRAVFVPCSLDIPREIPNLPNWYTRRSLFYGLFFFHRSFTNRMNWFHDQRMSAERIEGCIPHGCVTSTTSYKASSRFWCYSINRYILFRHCNLLTIEQTKKITSETVREYSWPSFSELVSFLCHIECD